MRERFDMTRRWQKGDGKSCGAVVFKNGIASVAIEPFLAQVMPRCFASAKPE